MSFRILFPDQIHEGALDFEQGVAGADAAFDVHHTSIIDEIPEASWDAADGIVVYHRMALDARAAALAKRCRIVVRAGVGFDHVDLDAWGRRGVPVCNTPDYGTTEVADSAIGYMLAFARGIASYDEFLRADPVKNWDYKLAPAMLRLRGARFGVVGFGRIGTAAAMRAKAFGMEVAFYDPYQPNGVELPHNFQRCRSLAELLGSSDVISVHTPLTAETRGMIDAKAVAVMKRGAILINTARGPICSLDALYDGLKDGRLLAVGLDVLPEEPANSNERLIAAWQKQEDWICGRLMVAPHAAFFSAPAFRDIRTKSMQTVMLYLGDGVLQNCVNLPCLKK
jgi:D-3-phosphoglycerate dehydrogenase/C-terminal binding protein